MHFGKFPTDSLATFFLSMWAMNVPYNALREQEEKFPNDLTAMEGINYIVVTILSGSFDSL